MDLRFLMRYGGDSYRFAITETEEHQRLQHDLEQFADGALYTDDQVDLEIDGNPDVVRLHADGHFLFIADAKDANHETALRADTVQRVLGYVRSFARLLKDGAISGGFIGIATNDEIEAEKWIATLDLCTAVAGVLDDNGNHLKFQVYIYREKTWITYAAT